MMHRCRGEPAETEHAPLVVRIDDTVGRASLEKRAAFCRRDPEHLARDGSKVTLTREEAVKRIRQLGFKEGDAERWLGSKPSSKSPKIAARRSSRLI